VEEEEMVTARHWLVKDVPIATNIYLYIICSERKVGNYFFSELI
jgi:hypothetical protein